MKGKNTADRQEFSRLYGTYAPMVYRRCYALLKDSAEAEDMVQDVFLRIFDRMDTLDISQPSSLLWNTATRLCLNRIRDKHRRGLDVDSSELLLNIACMDDDRDSDAKGILDRLFSREPESSRTIAVLHYVDCMTLEETAREVNLSVSGVRKRLRGLQAKIKTLEVK